MFMWQPISVHPISKRYLELDVKAIWDLYLGTFYTRCVCCILICRCMQTHNDAMKTSEDTSLEKCTPHFIERVVCERELETEQNCNILTLTLMVIAAFLSRSPGLLNRGPGGPASLGHGPHSSIFSPTHLRL